MPTSHGKATSSSVFPASSPCPDPCLPRLRIVLEHCTTKDALDAVRACGPTVVGSITAHHLYINTEDVLGDPFNFCKPVAKMPTDRVALLQAIADRSGKFFFGKQDP